MLRVVDYRESDRIVTLFSEELGRVSAIARAARRSQKRFGGGLESLCVVDVKLEPARAELDVLREARPLHPCLGLLGSLERIEAGGAALEMLRALLAERHPEPEVFRLVVDFLLELDAGAQAATRLLQFQLDALTALGFSPELERCGVCGKEAPQARAALFRPVAGAIVCRACGGGSLRLSAATRQALLARREGHETPQLAAAWPLEVQREARALVAELLEHQAGLRRPRSR